MSQVGAELCRRRLDLSHEPGVRQVCQPGVGCGMVGDLMPRGLQLPQLGPGHGLAPHLDASDHHGEYALEAVLLEDRIRMVVSVPVAVIEDQDEQPGRDRGSRAQCHGQLVAGDRVPAGCLEAPHRGVEHRRADPQLGIRRITWRAGDAVVHEDRHVLGVPANGGGRRGCWRGRAHGRHRGRLGGHRPFAVAQQDRRSQHHGHEACCRADARVDDGGPGPGGVHAATARTCVQLSHTLAWSSRNGAESHEVRRPPR